MQGSRNSEWLAFLCVRKLFGQGQKFTNNFSIFHFFFLFKSAMADNMPEQMIKNTYGDILVEYDDVEKMLEEAGLSSAGKTIRFSSVKAKRFISVTLSRE